MQALLTIVLPVFGTAPAGDLVGRFGLLGEHGSRRLSGFACWVALPALLLATLPTATLVVTLTQQYGVDVERSSSAFIATTALSVLTVLALLGHG